MEGNEFEELRQLVEFLKASGIAEFQMERPEMKVALKFVCEPAASPVAPLASGVDMTQLARMMAAQGAPESMASLPVAPMPAAPAAAAAETTEAAPDPSAGGHIIKSPIVGTFYDAPSPEAEPFVRVGDRVKVGQVLCIVEAMKLMNEIESDADGEVVKILVRTSQPVEYGQALFAVKA